MRKALANKVLVLGMDAMDPRLTKKFLAKGLMPNTQNLIDRGSCREDLVLLGGQPTVTPPMWTTMATGCNPNVHGITCFFRQGKNKLEEIGYNLDSRNCTAEPLWNVAVEAGKKTLVFHWPGSAWPPTSDNPLLHVVDGTQPAMVNMGISGRDSLFLAHASVNVDTTRFVAKQAAVGNIPCVIEDMKVDDDFNKSSTTENAIKISVKQEDAPVILLTMEEGEGGLNKYGFDAEVCRIKEPTGWSHVPKGARESEIYLSQGTLRRPILILKNNEGVYDHIAIYKNKKADEPIVTLYVDDFTTDILDEAIKNDQRYDVVRNMVLLSLEEDGSDFYLYVSPATDIHCDSLWHPKSLYKDVAENIGYPTQICSMGNRDKSLIEHCNFPTWKAHGKWQADAINYLIDKEDYDVVFSHWHFIDTMGHVFFKDMKGTDHISPEEYDELAEEVYQIADDYIGEFLHLIDEGWTIVMVSDHAQVCPEHEPHAIGDLTGLNYGVMAQLGYTVVKTDENGELLHEIDWTKTKAIANRSNHIYLNIKGRDKHVMPDGTVIDGLIDPEDQYEMEERIMTDLYGLKDEKTGKRIIALALRNRDAVLLGMGGPECGDILFWNAEGYNYDHCDSLSTTYGVHDTSTSPIFVAAGPGIKEGYVTDRWIRQVDVTPTLAVLAGLRMPKQCEGAPAYQILTEEY